MNIKSRLKKIETQIKGLDSEFCNCQKEIQTFVILPNPDGTSIREPAEAADAPEFCAFCKRRNPTPIEATFMITTR